MSLENCLTDSRHQNAFIIDFGMCMLMPIDDLGRRLVQGDEESQTVDAVVVTLVITDVCDPGFIRAQILYRTILYSSGATFLPLDLRLSWSILDAQQGSE